MPLSKSKTPKAFKSNVSELISSYTKSKMIGTSRPKTKAKAVKQAVAIAYAEQRKPKVINRTARLKALK